MKNEQIQTTITKEVPEWKLKLAYFYADHKTMIKRASYFLLLFADLIIVFWFGSLLVDYQTGTLKYEQQMKAMKANLINHQEVVRTQAPASLKLEEIKVIKSGTNKYDLLTIVKNGNKDWAVTRLDYAFEVGGQTSAIQSTFILPEPEKYLMHFNANSNDKPRLKIINTNWQRIKDFGLLSYKDSIELEEAKYSPSGSSQIVGQIEINLKNNSPFSFWEVGLPIILYDYNLEPIGINYLVINKFLSEEVREIKSTWTESLGAQVSSVGVYPEINLLDDGTIMKVEAKIGSPPGLEF